MAIRSYDLELDTSAMIETELMYGRKGDTTGSVVLNVSLNNNSVPIDLTGYTLRFRAQTPTGLIIEDSSNFNEVDLINGKFKYAVTSALWQETGIISTSYFIISDKNGNESTLNLRFQCLNSADFEDADTTDYIDQVEKTKAIYNSWFNQSKEIIGSIDPGGKVLTELIDARGSFNTLGARENNQDTQIATKSDKSYVDTMLSSIAQGGPKGIYYSLSALQTAFPSGADGTYLVFDSSSTDGAHSYIWDSSAKVWKDLGVYQAQAVPDDIANALSGLGIQSATSYPDLNNYPANSIIIIGDPMRLIAHAPNNSSNEGFTVATVSGNKGSLTDNEKGGTYQYLITQSGKKYTRIAWGAIASWTDWKDENGATKHLEVSSTNQTEYLNANNILFNQNILYTLNDMSATSNFPSNLPGLLVVQNGYTDDGGTNGAGTVQTYTTYSGIIYTRMVWGGNLTWTEWIKMNPSVKYINVYSQTQTDYLDADNLKMNMVATYGLSDPSVLINFPVQTTGSLTVELGLTDGNGAGAVQTFTTYAGVSYRRILWGSGPIWTDWKMLTSTEKNIVVDKQTQTDYLDADNLKFNQVITYGLSDPSVLINFPVQQTGVLIVKNGYVEGDGSNGSGTVQTYTTYQNVIYRRILWGSGPIWTGWMKVHYESTNDDDIPKPSISMFQKIGIIGDSYASGQIWTDFNGTAITDYSISWGQIMARQNGLSVSNYSEGGLTTRSWLTSSYGLTKMQADVIQDLYILVLGINDQNILGTDGLGTVNDISNGTDTFYGNYGKIIAAIKEKSPKAKLVFVDMVRTDENYSIYNTAIKNLADYYKVPMIHQLDDTYFNEGIYDSKMKGGHPRGVGYALMAEAFKRLIESCLLNSYDYFSDYKLTN
ncbi:BppU family phage baseplate upper protein [Liquorilactobacillus hordei]|uniref:BppU family phage baseplate upper protein n=1 Tax=Liquorilactobacillus hordei TaxID=468911 RepID=UPI0039EA066E